MTKATIKELQSLKMEYDELRMMCFGYGLITIANKTESIMSDLDFSITMKVANEQSRKSRDERD